MSIETTSVSRLVIRDNDNGSLHSTGGGTQGSATGSKEGQFGSFWDKAVFGAQKFFGMERSSNDDSEASGLDNGDDPSGEEAYSENRPSGHSRLASSFSGSSLGGRLLQTVRLDGIGGMLAIGSVGRSFDASSSEETSREVALGDRSEGRRRNSDEATVESLASAVDPEDHQDELSEEDEIEGNKAKVAEQSVRPFPFVGQIAMNARSCNLLNSNREDVTLGLESVGINHAKQTAIDPNMPSLTANLTPLTDEPSSLTSVEGDQSSSKEAHHGSAATGAAKSVRANAFWEKKSGIGKDSRVSGEVISQTAQSVQRKGLGEQAVKDKAEAIDSEARTTFGKNGGELTFDSEKVKHNLLKAFDKSVSLDVLRQGKAAEANSNAKLDRAEVTEPAGQSKMSANGDNGASEISATKKVGTHSLHEMIREIRPGNPRSQVSGAPRPTNLRMVASSLSAPSGGEPSPKAGMEAQSQGNSFGNSGKQDFDISAVREVAPKTNTVSPKGELQGFQMNSSISASSSKSQFAVKTESISYSSKSAEEVKEVYTALSKSVDRLVNTKGETINVRINFDQGGSMALKISMEGGQIKTMMQTDLPGLEGMIKSNWSELAADWNAKGVKLTAPQFTNSEGELAREEGSGNFFQRESQSQNEFSGKSGSRGNRRSETAVVGSNVGASQSESVSHADESEGAGEQELKTYA
ncbi:MAG: hypothetical protein P8L49_03390 [Opitutaceae bacterium]|nr:hypothetical protein [Opitutaceae bacterium]